MNYQQAVEYSKTTGKKIKHEYFCDDEYFVWSRGKLRCELGYDMTPWYKGLDWQNETWYAIAE